MCGVMAELNMIYLCSLMTLLVRLQHFYSLWCDVVYVVPPYSVTWFKDTFILFYSILYFGSGRAGWQVTRESHNLRLSFKRFKYVSSYMKIWNKWCAHEPAGSTAVHEPQDLLATGWNSPGQLLILNLKTHGASNAAASLRELKIINNKV